VTGAPILLCENVTFRCGSGQALVFPWVGFPSTFQCADLLVEVKLVEAGPLDAVLQSSTDGTQPTEAARVPLSAVDVVPVFITSGLRQLVRLVLESSGAAGMVVSAWLLPKEAGAAAAPTGTIFMWGGNSSALPSGWLLCDGAAVSRKTYATLFAVVGTAFGPGDGSTTFNLPDYRQKFPRGAINDAQRGGTGGSETPAVSITDPAHSHVAGGLTTGPTGATAAGGATPVNTTGDTITGATAPATTGITASIADGRPPFLSVHFMIKT
jgi:microcystin-dependent protein